MTIFETRNCELIPMKSMHSPSRRIQPNWANFSQVCSYDEKTFFVRTKKLIKERWIYSVWCRFYDEAAICSEGWLNFTGKRKLLWTARRSNSLCASEQRANQWVERLGDFFLSAIPKLLLITSATLFISIFLVLFHRWPQSKLHFLLFQVKKKIG